MSRNSSSPPRVALAALRLSPQAQRAAPPIDDNSHKTSVPWFSWTAMLNNRSQFRHNCTGERLPKMLGAFGPHGARLAETQLCGLAGLSLLRIGPGVGEAGLRLSSPP